MNKNNNEIEKLCKTIGNFSKSKIKELEMEFDESGDQQFLIDKQRYLDLANKVDEIQKLFKHLNNENTPEAYKEILNKQIDKKLNELLEMYDKFLKEDSLKLKNIALKKKKKEENKDPLYLTKKYYRLPDLLRSLMGTLYFDLEQLYKSPKLTKEILEEIEKIKKYYALCQIIIRLLEEIVEALKMGIYPTHKIEELEMYLEKLRSFINIDKYLQEKIEKIDRDHVIIKIERPAKEKEPAKKRTPGNHDFTL